MEYIHMRDNYLNKPKFDRLTTRQRLHLEAITDDVLLRVIDNIITGRYPTANLDKYPIINLRK